MKTSYIVIAIVVVVLLAGGGYFLASQNNKATSTSMAEPTAAPMNDPDMDGDSHDATENTMMASPSTASGAADTSAMTGDVQEVTVTASNFKFEPSTINVKMGQPVKVTFKNAQGFHDFVVDGMPEAKTTQIQSPNETSVTFTPTKAGTFEYYCSVGKHRQMGMKGTLVVQ